MKPLKYKPCSVCGQAIEPTRLLDGGWFVCLLGGCRELLELNPLAYKPDQFWGPKEK